MKKQRVRFSKGDKRPAKYSYKLSYEKKLVKKGKKIVLNNSGTFYIYSIGLLLYESFAREPY